MGRWSYSSKYEVEDCKEISIGFLKQYGYLSKGRLQGTIQWSCDGNPTGSAGIRVSFPEMNNVCVSYSITDTDQKKESINNYISIIKTPCNYGGKRHWFLCPFCSRKALKLYLSPGNNYFGCRKCLQLSYRSQKSNHHKGIFAYFSKVFSLDKKKRMYFLRAKRYYYRKEFTKNIQKAILLSRQIKRISGSAEF